MARNPKAERFFFLTALALLALVVAGFASQWLAIPGSIGRIAPVVQLHGVIFLAWFVLLSVQAGLIGRGNYKLHMTLGGASMVLVMAMLVFGVLATRNALARPDWTIGPFVGPAAAVFPTFDLVTFTPFYAAAIALRKRPDLHKRLMLIASFMLIDPAAARLGFFAFGNPLVGMAIELALFAALLTYDWRSRGRPHWVSVIGTVVFFGGLALRFAIGSSEGWPSFAMALYGM